MTELLPHHRKEMLRLLEVATGSKSVLEIGSRYGYFLRKLSKVMERGGRVVAVDLPGGPWGAKSQETLELQFAEMKTEGMDTHLFLGDSKDTSIIEKVRQLGPFDFVFIDGDHSYEGVKADWENYGPMGKIVALHDIKRPTSKKIKIQVWKLWQEIQGDKEEYIGLNSNMGIGIVRNQGLSQR